MTSINTSITDRFRISREKDREKYKAAEVEKLGNLRAGSTGIMNSEGEVAGACHRKSHLRSLGVEADPPTTDKLIMFELGYANEDRILQVMNNTLAEGEVILREEEIPIEWHTDNGTKVTGRPDIVVCRTIPSSDEIRNKIEVSQVKPKAELGLELKSVHSVWVAKEVLFNCTPKMANITQSAHYMWKLDIPYKLVYRGYSNLGQGMADWGKKLFPQQGDPMSEYIEYNDKGGIKHIKPFDMVYDLEFSKHGRLQFRVEGTQKWTQTMITQDDIKRYFEFTSQMAVTGNLGPRPLAINPVGDKLNYTDCQYCPLKSTCDTYEKSGYGTWKDNVLKFVRDRSDKQK